MHELLNVQNIIESGGLILIGLIVFAESGLLIGFFLPGDTLLFTAGLFASQGKLPLLLTLVVIWVCGIAGDNTGYMIGHKMGRRLFKKEDGIIFRKDHLQKAEAFYEKHGIKVVLIARFIPMGRTFAPLVAGAGNMSHKRYALYDMVGVALWGGSVTILGYYFGSKIPNIDKYILPILALVILASFGSSIFHMVTDKKIRARLLGKFRRQTPSDEPVDAEE